MPGLCRYLKKVTDEYPWTQVVPDDPTALPPNDTQIPKYPPKYPQRLPIERIVSGPRLVRAKMLYRRLVDDVEEIFVLLHTSYFSKIARVCMVTKVNICNPPQAFVID